MQTRGFTVVELVIVITIMSILLILALVNVRSTQIQARDSERHVDVQNIATALESFHDKLIEGRQYTYPASAISISNRQMAPLESALKHVKDSAGSGSLYAPGVDEATQDVSLVMAMNASQTATSVSPAPTTTTYVYQALTADNTLCIYNSNVTCAKYNIFYQLEQPIDTCPAPTNTCIYRSRHQ